MRLGNNGFAVMIGLYLCLQSPVALAETADELYQRAVSYEQTGEMPRAEFWYRKSAEAGSLAGQLRLGKLYREGVKLPQDFVNSAYYYQMAAEQGNPVAEYKLGTMYYGGQGVDQDNQQAVFWFTRSAKQGLPQAVHALDVMRMNGHCCNVG